MSAIDGGTVLITGASSGIGMAIAREIALRAKTLVLVARRIQKLDPAGIAARDLQECLAVQLDVMPNHNPTRELAKRIISERFDDFVNKRYTSLSRHLSLEMHDLKAPIELIQRLNPGCPSSLLKTHLLISLCHLICDFRSFSALLIARMNLDKAISFVFDAHRFFQSRERFHPA